jgi:methionyl-tRNA formyltransferase
MCEEQTRFRLSAREACMAGQMVASKANRVVLFSSDDVLPNIILNHALPAMVEMGLDPLVFLTPLLVHKAPPPSLERLGFYERDILYSLIFPALENHESSLRRTGHGLLTFKELGHTFGGFERIEQLDDPRVTQAIDHPAFLGAISAHNQLLFRGRHIEHVRRRGGFLWNLHHGPLPDNRGLLASFWNLLEGRTAHGVSLHEIDTGIDTGALVVTARLRLSQRQSILASMIDLGVPGAHLLVQTLGRLVAGMPVWPLPQARSKGIYRSYPCEEDIVRAHGKGINLTGCPIEMASLYADLYGLSKGFEVGTLVPALMKYEREWLARYPGGETSAPSVPKVRAGLTA